MPNQVIVLDTGVRIIGLEVPVKGVADFFRTVPEQEHEFTMLKAIEVGTFCLERGRTAQDTDFVKRQITELLTTVEKAVCAIPTKTEEALIAKLGTADGQALAPVRQLLKSVSDVSAARVDEVKKLLSQDIDPSKSTSAIGSALQKIRDLLDVQRSDSVQASVQSALKSVTDRDGELAKVVKLTVEAAIKPLSEDVTKLSTAVIGQEMVQQALEETPEKGPWYEEEVAGTLQPWAKAVGAQVEHVGGDNQPGDFVVQLTEGSTSSERVRVVIEARAQKNKMGVQRISQDLNPKFAERKADAAVYVSKTREGFAKEVGDWAEGVCEKGPWVACTHEHLITALRFLIVQYHLKRLRESTPEINASAIQSQVNSIRTTLGKIKGIKSKVTDLTDTAGEIAGEADQIRSDINASLSAIEEMLRVTKKPAAVAVVDGPFTKVSSN